ncbi:MAG: hypothetical protein WAZ98_11620 [Cyclobacteriaceae bacterium]
MKFDFLTCIKVSIFLILIAIPLAITYDVLFSKPLVMRGVIVDKIHFPGKSQSGQNILPYMKYKSNDYIITAQQEEQWIAFVKTNDGQILKVNCHLHHYEQTQIGDTLRFKEYTGEIFHIDYFSHNEEDEETANIAS